MRCAGICLILLATSVVGATQSQGQTLTTLYTFTGPEGSVPFAGVIRDSAGNLYGTTFYGGAYFNSEPYGFGVVFKLDTSNNETVLYSFAGGTDGANPYGGVIRDSAGNLYGTTSAGGSPTCQCGTVFKVSSGGKETVLYRFRGGTDGAFPWGGVIRDSAGNLYGTTSAGGYKNYGTIYKINASGQESVLYRFRGGSDTYTPAAALIRDSAGNLYGTTCECGPTTANQGGGILFELNTNNHLTVLAGLLYGSSFAAPTFCYSGAICGTSSQQAVWEVTKSDEYITLYSPSYSGGSDFNAGVVEDSAGNLYGAAGCCGGGDWGVLYEVTKGGVGKTLYDFNGYADGGYPQGNLVLDNGGNLYATAPAGGDGNCISGYSYGCGVVYKFTP
jgi:uncharacterized repeat protein (TIGR03803 family)